ncbi:hypothetical protein ACP275_06G026600 [Erythranthe tilingii]
MHLINVYIRVMVDEVYLCSFITNLCLPLIKFSKLNTIFFFLFSSYNISSSMETSSSASLQLSPSNESFSYSWLANLNTTSFEDNSLMASSIDYDQDEANYSFIEMDPRLPPSKRFFRVSSDFGFDFDFPVSDSPLGLVHADELISNGFIVPLFVKDVKRESISDDVQLDSDTWNASTSSSSADRKTVAGRVRCASLMRCRRFSKRFFQKYLKFLLRPLFWKRRRGHNGQFDKSGKTNWELSAATTISPRTSLAYSADDNWRTSCDSESSIYEAVLHCKRTQGN